MGVTKTAWQDDREKLEDQCRALYTNACDHSGYGGARVAAAITDGHWWGFGYNIPEAAAWKGARKPKSVGTHAEIVALAEYTEKNSFQRYALVARAKKAKRGGPWVPGLARPCKYCMDALREFGIYEVVYTTGGIGVDGRPEIKWEYVQ